MARDDAGFMLRIPADLKKRLQEAAKANRRSMNSEIIHCLNAQLGMPRGTTLPEAPAENAQAVDAIRALLDRIR